ncbi:hypothetical protein LPJ62_002961 [Coemansia sp. RSA 2167]|nr:hypothetical protein LPJ62_002961 [Coemansia sp. RSA 2167]KAJ2128177.1 hypothetical protein GGH17_004493 [Coemansia sp. RSA 788]KAJ2134516.1 hypothetical protein J3F82_006747 [Coemansia sp. RSA 637]KAJ2143128.1 hypothetical protein IW142_003912 [Coemansia sp. RSA 564]KAJ2154221.1 hypothetical protein GGH15_005856 [Coemansia sp. RSA 562]KAJ2178261.1 hypothetical protein GGF45_002930 [Coemansia sp. RSA 551]KAJ2178994.1 hypothetical protein EV181_006040 [Coemansia sp. RSA 532]KAJ2187021.1 hy
MKFSLISCVFLLSGASAYVVNDLSDSVNCRAGPNTTTAVVKQYLAGDIINIKCQVSSQRVFNYAIWDKTQDNCYISDYYVETGVSSNYVERNCLYRGSNPGRTVDDYRYKNQCDEVDPWNYYICQCVSFVAQRINERQGIYFTNRYKGQIWGNANEWVDAAHNSTDVTVDTVPRKGCIAQHSRSQLGHVAWVHDVNYKRKLVTIEQYNVVPHKYSKETVAWDAFDYYIHLDNEH